MCNALLTSCCFCLVVATHCPCKAENQVFEFLLSHGATISPNEVVRLAPPTMADGLRAAEQRRAIEKIPNSSHSWEELTRRSVVAPFILNISKDDSHQRMCCRTDVWFVAYGTLRGIRNARFLQNQPETARSNFDLENGVTIRPLTDRDLTNRGLRPPHREDDPHYFADELRLLGRVRISMTTRAATTQTQDSIVSASMLDTRFANDSQFPNFWRPISRDESGRRSLGRPQPYSGYGGYAKATKLITPPGAVFIEYHLVFAEPDGWFGGSNALRSKLPLVAQYMVRELRRECEQGH
jgi:hypothetical protein